MKSKILASILSIGLIAGMTTASSTEAEGKFLSTAARTPMALRGYTPLANPLPMPSVRLFTQDGEEIDLKKYKGKVLILNLWASWCMPCIQEIPALSKIQKQLNGSNVVIMGVNLESNTNQVLRFLKKKQYEGFQTWLDPSGTISSALPITGIPTSLVLNANGEISAVIPGYVPWDDPEVLSFLKKLENKLAKPTAEAKNI